MPLNAEIFGVWADLCCQGCSKTLSRCCVCVGCRSTTSLFSWEAGSHGLPFEQFDSSTGKQPIKKLCLMALYRAMRLRFGYGFESCDANGPRNIKNANIAKHRPIFLPPLLLVGSKELVLKMPKRGQFHAAIRVPRKRCDSCAQVALGTRTVSRRNF